MKKIQSKAILILISVSLILGVVACSKDEPEQVDPTVESELDTDTVQSDLGQETIEQESNMNNYEDLNGKKFLIIGNSYVYNGLSVVKKTNSVVDQESRSNDQGYFYQLCKANGYEVSVTNWTFGGHGLYELFGATCKRASCGCRGQKHEDQLTDRYFDYVLVSPGGGDTSEKNIENDFNYIINFFKSSNPNVKFVCIGNLGAHGYSSYGTVEPRIYNYYKTLEEMGVIIADWGGLVNGIIESEYKVSGAQQEYLKKTFIIKDGYHPNALSGYITSLMAYCAITGDSPLVQPYEFCTDSTLNSAFDMEKYIENNYINEDTNFLDVFNSNSDMVGILQLVDNYLKSKPYGTTNDSQAGDVTEMRSFETTLMSFNIKTDATADARTDACAEFILNSGASIIGLQEVQPGQYAAINSLISGKYETIWHSRNGGTWGNGSGEGLAISYDKSEWELQSKSIFWLSETPNNVSTGWGASYRRICLSALLKHKETGEMLNVFNTHLDNNSAEARLNGMKLILEHIAESDYPVYLCGDMNCRIGSEPITLVSDVLRSAQTVAQQTDYGVTYQNMGNIDDYATDANENEITAIDFCFVSERIQPKTFSICRDKYGTNNDQYLSDHYAVKTTVNFNYN